jgi:hypothetical protein
MITQPTLIAASILLATSTLLTASTTPTTGIPLNQPVIASSTPPTSVSSSTAPDTTSLASTTTDIANTAPAPIDYTGLIPGITNVQASTTATSTTITWETADQVSNSVVQYGTSTSYTATSTGPLLSIDHMVTLQNLLPDTTYHYMVSSTNGYGTVDSIDQTVTTQGSPTTSDNSPPVQSLLSVMPPVTSLDPTALVSWTTDQPTAGWVLYGPSTLYKSESNQDTNVAQGQLGEDHIVLLTGLSPGRTYHFIAVSQNAAGAWSATPDQTFSTAA